jgi:serine/threonine-protein kinase RsbW
MRDDLDKPSSETGKRSTTLRLQAILTNVPVAIDCVTRSAEAAGFEDPVLYQVQLAVDEACANVVHHAYRGMEPGDMEVSCTFDGQCLVIRVRDWGRGFSPEDVPEPDVKAPLEKRTFGGLGLFLLKQVMDQVEYTFDRERGNELTMVKRLQAAG